MHGLRRGSTASGCARSAPHEHARRLVRHLEVEQLLDWRARREVAAERLSKQEAQDARAQDVAKARTRDTCASSPSATDDVDGELRIVGRPAADRPDRGSVPARRRRREDDRRARCATLIRSYRRTLARPSPPDRGVPRTSTPPARSSASAASARARGSCCWSAATTSDPLFLQAKEAQPSVLERFVGKSELRQPRPAGRRRPAPDAGGERHLPRLACASRDLDGDDPRLLRPPAPRLEGRRRRRDLPAGRAPTLYARLCGATLARAHARSGDRIAIASYLGKGDAFDRAIADFSAAYADQNERDYETFADAVRVGPARGGDRPVDCSTERLPVVIVV